MASEKRSKTEDSGTRIARRRKHLNRRLIVYGSIATLVYGAWIWQPYEFDFIPRTVPEPNPAVEPNLAHLFKRGTKVLVVTAHPDDSAFYIGGFLTQLGRAGAEIHQIICTDGDKAYYWIFAEPESLRKVWRQEAINELHGRRGQDVLFLGRPDGRLRADAALVKRIRERIDEVRPEYVVSFDGDFPPRFSHQDHRRSGDATELAVKGAPSVQWLMKFSTIAPNWICDISADWNAQQALLEIHRSQFSGAHLEQVTNMVEDSAMKDGRRLNVTYGEGFRCIRTKLP